MEILCKVEDNIISYCNIFLNVHFIGFMSVLVMFEIDYGLVMFAKIKYDNLYSVSQ